MKIELKYTKLFPIPRALLKQRNLNLVDFTGSPINCSCSTMSYLRHWNVSSLSIEGYCNNETGVNIHRYVAYEVPAICL